MKNLLLFIAFCSLSTCICAQDTSPENHFVALYTLGESWDMEKQPDEQLYFKEHSAFLSQLRKEKKILIGARYSDTGMLVLKAKDLETIKELLHQDIAIQNKLFNVIIHPFNPFYKGCIE